MTADDELDERQRARLRGHFEAAAAHHTAPPFETMLASAEAAAAPRTHRWRYVAAGAIAASLAAVALVELWLPSPDPESALIAELSATTYLDCAERSVADHARNRLFGPPAIRRPQ